MPPAISAKAVKAPDRREQRYAPRGLRREAAAFWVGFSPSKFDELVKDGRMPKGKLVDGCRVWDRYLLDMSWDDLPDGDAALDNASAAKAWADVK